MKLAGKPWLICGGLCGGSGGLAVTILEWKNAPRFVHLF
jgi:hypothetical protein